MFLSLCQFQLPKLQQITFYKALFLGQIRQPARIKSNSKQRQRQRTMICSLDVNMDKQCVCVFFYLFVYTICVTTENYVLELLTEMLRNQMLIKTLMLIVESFRNPKISLCYACLFYRCVLNPQSPCFFLLLLVFYRCMCILI